MTDFVALYGIIAALLVLTAGYLLGVRNGVHARDALRGQLLQQAEELQRQASWGLANGSDLQVAIQQVLAPLLQRERLSIDLAQFHTDVEQRRNLAVLLDKIAAIGNFSSVILSNEEGLPLAANEGARDLDSMAATATRLLLVADQVAGDQGTAPIAVLVRNAANSVTLCRIFQVQGQRISLTAVCADSRLNSLALDPALVRIETMLSAPPDEACPAARGVKA